MQWLAALMGPWGNPFYGSCSGMLWPYVGLCGSHPWRASCGSESKAWQEWGKTELTSYLSLALPLWSIDLLACLGAGQAAPFTDLTG